MKILNILSLGGSGPILAEHLLLGLLADRACNTTFGIRIHHADFDYASDSFHNLVSTTNALCLLNGHLTGIQEGKRVLGCLDTIYPSHAYVLNGSQEFNKTIRSYISEQATAAQVDAAQSAMNLLFSNSVQSITLGKGGYGSGSVGHLAASVHHDSIENMVATAVKEANNDPDDEHYFVVTASTNGSSGYTILPKVLKGLAQHAGLKTYCLLDCGLFTAHSSAYTSSDYLGSREVQSKASACLKDLQVRKLLAQVQKVIVLQPLASNKPYKLCEKLALEGTQQRHACIEYLLGARILLDALCGKLDSDNNFSQYQLITLSKDANCTLPATWEDLGLDSREWHRLIQLLALGAATRYALWSQDDDNIRNNAVINKLLKNHGYTLQQAKEEGLDISGVCNHLLSLLVDCALTGSDWELCDTPSFTVADNFRLMNITAARKVMAGEDCTARFTPNELCRYKAYVNAREIKVNGGKKVSLVDVDRKAGNLSCIAAYYSHLFSFFN